MARPLRIASSLLVLGALAWPVASLAPAVAQAPKSQPTPSPQPPVAVAKPQAPPQFPTTLEPSKVPDSLPAAQWSQAEIEEAQAKCAVILSGLNAVALPADPVREGECGAPAAIQLVSIGQSPPVTLSQPALVTCGMAAALDRWIKESVQPAAKRHLGSPVIRIHVMSGYSCRRAYGRKKGRLSEHGRANALDIRGFLTERNVTVEISSGWGLTARDVKAHAMAAEAARREAEKVPTAKAPGTKTVPPKASDVAAGEPPPTAGPAAQSVQDLRGPVVETRPLVQVPKLPDLGIVKRDPQGFSLNPPSRLGGPKQTGKEAPRIAAASDPSAGQQAFLRQIHADACKIFGTILGPESNDAHRDHFHVDMAHRQRSNFCE